MYPKNTSLTATTSVNVFFVKIRSVVWVVVSCKNQKKLLIAKHADITYMQSDRTMKGQRYDFACWVMSMIESSCMPILVKIG